MKRITALCILFGIRSVFAIAAEAPKTGFYRKGHTTAKPRDAVAPVVVNAASFEPGVSPGGLATVFGQNLTDVTGTIVADTNPLPLRLAGVSVTVNGIPAPVFSVSSVNGQDQISFQVPYEAPTGPEAADVEVFDYGTAVATITADSFTEDPGLFTYDGNYVVAQASGGSLISPSNPALPGEVIVLYTTGLGPLTLTLADGYGAPSGPLAYTVDPFQVIVENESATVLFAGLAPGFVGLYQINIEVPSDLPSGDLNIQITSPYASSQIDILPVR